MMNADLEALRALLSNQEIHLALGLIKQVAVASDRSVCRVMVSILPEQREVVARMSWEAVGPEAGVFMLPNVNDLVLVGMVEGSKDQVVVIRRFTSREDKMPINAANGDLVAKALSGKKTWVQSDTKILLAKTDTEPTENLVLGQQLKTLLSDVLAALAAHKHIGNLGYYTAPPDNASTYTAKKANPVDNEGILSNLAFTEKG